MVALTDALRPRVVWLISHDRTIDDAQIAGRNDLSIRPSPRGLYERLRKMLPDPDPVLITAEVRRCQQTATRLVPGRQWEVSDLVQARDYGQWASRNWEQIRGDDAARCEAFWNDHTAPRPPGGESLREVTDRTDAFLLGLSHREQWKTAIVVTTPEIIRIAVANCLELPARNILRLSIDPLSATSLSHTWMGWQVDAVNVVL